jgi:hypothetical protein
MSEQLLGFFSLLMSYVKTTTVRTNRQLGPKQALHIMPRNDWAKLNDMYGKDDEGNDASDGKRKRCKRKRKNSQETLWNIVQDLANKKGISNVGQGTFKWDTSAIRKVRVLRTILDLVFDQITIYKQPIKIPPTRKDRKGNDIPTRPGKDNTNIDWTDKARNLQRKELDVQNSPACLMN